jgi:ABC-type glycerol-3-phosphate transport system substrate-binding protein
MDDVVKRVIEKNGPVSKAVESIGFQGGHWLGVPMSRGSLLMGCTARFDMIKEYAGIDVQALYPAGKPPNDADWTWDAFLAAAEKCHKAGHEFGLPLGLTTDSYLWVGALFLAHGAELMNAKGDITVRTDKVKQVMEFGKKISAFCPSDAQAWDDASNNKALISGKAALIFNPPSAWAVAKRDAPQVAEKCWFIGFPKGPAGRFNPTLPRFYGVWNFGKNKEQAKGLLEFLAMRQNAEKQVAASQGYDLPPYVKFNDFKTWDEEGPPKGALTHYPIKGGDQQPGVVCSPAPPLIAAQISLQAIMPQMIVRYARGGESMDKVFAWVENELEGFKRT